MKFGIIIAAGALALGASAFAEQKSSIVTNSVIITVDKFVNIAMGDSSPFYLILANPTPAGEYFSSNTMLVNINANAPGTLAAKFDFNGTAPLGMEVKAVSTLSAIGFGSDPYSSVLHVEGRYDLGKNFEANKQILGTVTVTAILA